MNSSMSRIKSSPSKSYSSANSQNQQQRLMIEITDPSSYDQENNPLNLNRIQQDSSG